MAVGKIQIEKVEKTDITVSFSELDKYTPFTHREIHMHEEYELLVPISGEEAVELDRGLITIPENSVVLIRPYAGHRCIFRSEGMHRFFWVLIKTENRFLDLLLDEDSDGNVIRLKKEDFDGVIEALKIIAGGRTSTFEGYSAFFDMLRLLEKGNTVKLSEERENIPMDVKLALEYMEKHLTEKIDVERMAQACHVSINTLERHFRKYLLLNPSEALRRKRLITAAKLLSHEYSISEVCEKCGFGDYSYFISLFGKFYGMTPLKYQKIQKNRR